MAGPSDLARDLLVRAGDDLMAARVLADSEQVSDAVVGFHCQQAVEKSLKAVLGNGGVRFPMTHDLALLLDLIDQTETDLPDELRSVDLLTPFGVHLRYVTIEDALLVTRDDALSWAERCVTWAGRVVNGDV